MKNCGDYLHFQIAERSILPEMVKIVKKKASVFAFMLGYLTRVMNMMYFSVKICL